MPAATTAPPVIQRRLNSTSNKKIGFQIHPMCIAAIGPAGCLKNTDLPGIVYACLLYRNTIGRVGLSFQGVKEQRKLEERGAGGAAEESVGRGLHLNGTKCINSCSGSQLLSSSSSPLVGEVRRSTLEQ